MQMHFAASSLGLVRKSVENTSQLSTIYLSFFIILFFVNIKENYKEKKNIQLWHINITLTIQQQSYFSSSLKKEPQSFKCSTIPVKIKLDYLQCNILKVIAVQYYFCKICCCFISHFSNS